MFSPFMTDTQLTATFLLQLAVVLLVCRGVGWLGQKFGQPMVVGEMVAGFLMGPSLFGWLAPGIQERVFPQETLRVLFVVSQLGLVLFMFCVGLDFRTDLMLRHARRAAAVSIAGIVAPFALGGALALWLFRLDGFFAEQVTVVQSVLFLGAAMAITAFPMLARIIYEHGIAGTALGTLALAAGAMDDAAAWIILAIVVGSFTGSTILAWAAAGGGVFYVIAVLAIRKPLLEALSETAERQRAVPPWMLGTVLCGLVFAAWFTDTVGIHAVFGAFVLGAAIPRGILRDSLQRTIEPVTTALLIPLFFAYTGLRCEISLVNSMSLWGIAIAIFVTACAGKGVGCWAAARSTGASPRDALGVATLMNTRGMMELILLNIGLQRGLITPTLFTILVMMAIGTTLMTGPLFRLIYRTTVVEPAADRLAMGETP